MNCLVVGFFSHKWSTIISLTILNISNISVFHHHVGCHHSVHHKCLFTSQRQTILSLIFSMLIKIKEKKEESWKTDAFKTKYAMAYLCLIPMQYGVQSCSWNWHDSACLDKNFGEPVQWDVTVTKQLQTEGDELCVNIRVHVMSSCFTHCRFPKWSCFILQILILLCQWKKYFMHFHPCCKLLLFSCPPKSATMGFFFFFVMHCYVLCCHQCCCYLFYFGFKSTITKLYFKPSYLLTFLSCWRKEGKMKNSS